MYSWFTQSNYLQSGGSGSTGQGATGLRGATGVPGPMGVTGPSGGGATGAPGATGLRGLDGDGILWVQAALLGTASNSTGYFSVQPGNSNPFGTPIDTSASSYGNGAVNGLKIPFDYELREVYLSVAHCAVGTASAASLVNLNLDCHTFQGATSSVLGTITVPLDGTKCGVYNNLGADNFQKAAVIGVTGIGGTAGDLFGFRFRNVLAATDVNAVSRCTVLVKLQRLNWTPGGVKGETGVQGTHGDTGVVGPMGVTGPFGGPSGTTGVPGAPGDTMLWAQASLLGTASNTVGLYSIQGGISNPAGIPISNPSDSYGNGGVQALRLPWPYVVSEVHVSAAHLAVSSGTADVAVAFNLDFHRYKGMSSALVGSVAIPLDGALCGVFNNLGGDSYQAAGVSGLGLTGPANELVGWSFRNVGGTSDINSVSRSTVLVKFQKQGT